MIASNLHFLASPTPPITLTLIREFAGDARVFFRRFEGGLTKLPKGENRHLTGFWGSDNMRLYVKIPLLYL
ncbi:hypothetical protein SPLC1_S520790 [Arthrospira platensis C1]|nr:hypothetical protein SPLC1_S520790 [Arthrospira platensis C1]